MPGYAGSGQAALLYENTQVLLWNNETVSVGELSIAYQFRRVASGLFYPWGFAAEVQFSGAPGAFEIDVVGAETDASVNFIKLAAITSVNASNIARLDALTYYPKYIAALVVSLANASSVKVTCKVTR